MVHRIQSVELSGVELGVSVHSQCKVDSGMLQPSVDFYGLFSIAFGYVSRNTPVMRLVRSDVEIAQEVGQGVHDDRLFVLLVIRSLVERILIPGSNAIYHLDASKRHY